MSVNRPTPPMQYQRYPSAAPEGLELGLGDLVAILVRRWPILLGITLLVAALTVSATYFMTPLYRSATLIKIDPTARAISDTEVRNSSPQADTSRLDTEVEILNSRAVALQVAERLDLANDPEFNGEDSGDEISDAERLGIAADTLREHITVTRDSNSYIVNLQVSSVSGEKAAKLANALAETYVGATVNERTGTAATQAAFLQQRLSTLGAEIAAEETQMAQYRARSGIVASTQQGTVTDQQVGPIASQVASAESDAAAARADYEAARAQVAKGQGTAISSVLNSATIGELRRQRSEVARELAQIEERYGPRHPEYARVTVQLQQLNAGINEEAQRILGSLESRARSAEARASSLRSTLSQLRAEQADSSQASAIASTLERQLKGKQDAYDRLSETLQGVSQQQRDVIPTASIVQAAAVPLLPYSPNRVLFAALGLIFGLLLSLAIILVLELMSRTVRSGDELERITDVPFLTSVPALAGSKLKDGNGQLSPDDFVVRKPMSGYAEAFRTIRNSLVLGVEKPASAIAVVSALPSEGKSTVALSLARTMAMAGDRVILVDCDLRRGRLLKAINGSTEQGLVEVLTGEASLEETILKDTVTQLEILALKENSFTPIDLFSGERMRTLVSELRARYDFVIFDTAPTLVVADSRIISSLSDGVVFVARADKTTRRAAKLATEMLQSDRTNVIGTILSMVASPRKRSEHDPAYYQDSYRAYQQN